MGAIAMGCVGGAGKGLSVKGGRPRQCLPGQWAGGDFLGAQQAVVELAL